MNAEKLAKRIHDWLEREADVNHCLVTEDEPDIVNVEMDDGEEFVIIVEDA